MNEWSIKDKWVFFSVAGAVLVYILYMMIRRRKGERAGEAQVEAEL
jgi:hypothetical protein